MKRTTRGMIVLSALMAMGALDVAAQAQDQQRRRPARGAGVEAIMQMRDRLELTEEQLAQLEEIRSEAVASRNVRMAEMAELRSRLRAGEIRRSEMMAYMEEQRDANAGVAEERRARIEAILDEEQRAVVQEMRDRARESARGRDGARRGPRGDARPGERPGPRNRRGGFEPGS